MVAVTTPSPMAAEAIDGHPVLGEIIVLTLRVLEAMRVQLRVYERAVIQRAGSEDTGRRLMSAPGVGTVVALCVLSAKESGRPKACWLKCANW